MSSVQSLDRAFNILEIISEHQSGISLTDLSERSGLHKSTVFRLASSLMENGYIEQTANSLYKITYKMYEIGSRVYENLSIIEAARDSLEKLVKEVGEVGHLVIRNDTKIIYIDKINSGRNSAIMGSSIGSTAPMYCTSVGKAMLFNAKEKEIKNLWEKSKIVGRTESTITDVEDFIEDIKISKERGYSIDNEENELGIRCIGAPIYNSTNNICGALSISGPISRINSETLESYAQPLIEATQEISRKMGYLG